MDSLESKMRSPDRILILTPLDPSQKSTGLIAVDSTNALHAKRNDQTGLWYLQYERGTLPEPLKQTYTSFKALVKYASEYFQKRNLKIEAVKD